METVTDFNAQRLQILEDELCKFLPNSQITIVIGYAGEKRKVREINLGGRSGEILF
jgi:hypothetical protein